jgi:hypothetical protein
LDCIVPVNNFFLDGIPVNNLMLWHFSVVSKKFRQPVVISQRHLVPEEEKNHALERAKEFKSRHPFAGQVMMESYVYVGFFMVM